MPPPTFVKPPAEITIKFVSPEEKEEDGA